MEEQLPEDKRAKGLISFESHYSNLLTNEVFNFWQRFLTRLVWLLPLVFFGSVAHAADWRMCEPGERNGPSKRCLVDGDTIWIGGMDMSLRLQSFDTPEPYTDICGGEAEVALAHQASARVLQLLNTTEWTVETFGIDGTGDRMLATIWIDGHDLGDILISEGLARRWPDGDEWWCR